MQNAMRLMADYNCWPLWWMNGDGDIDPHSLPLTPQTIERLLRWSATFDAVLNWDDPASSEWPSVEAHDAFYREGYELWLVVRDELAGSYSVFYQEFATVFPEPGEYYNRIQLSERSNAMMSDDEAPARVFARYLAAGQLAFQRCAACAAAIFYPRVLCPNCGATDLRWEISSGRGTVYATTTLHPRGEHAYNVALIDLVEGFRMMSRVDGIKPAGVRIGMEVRLRVLPAQDDAEAIAVFEPREAAQ